jgi:hypothetical protein
MSAKNKGGGKLASARVLRTLLAAAWLGACGGAVSTPTVGGESHFLRHCETSCGDGLTCLSGVCTRGCVVDRDKCDDLSPRAVCTDQSIEPGKVAVCDLACEANDECSVLGSNYACEGGFCRGRALQGNEPSTGGSSGSAGTAGVGGTGGGSGGGATGGGAGEGGSVAAAGCDSRADCPVDFECVQNPQNQTGVCVDASRNADCQLDGSGAPCPEGYACGNGESGPRCFPVAVNCVAPWTCEAADPPLCPYGFGRARVMVRDGIASCFGDCVPLSACECDDNDGCPTGSECVAGSCTPEPWQPPALCALPYQDGDCDGAFRVFTFQDGRCIETAYGGCGGNENRFGTLDECLATCAGVPLPHGCSDGSAPRELCVSCGPAGGCGETINACPRACKSNADCEGTGLVCDVDGFCGIGVGQCI